jgi:iron complex transport system substrate-binding protein
VIGLPARAAAIGLLALFAAVTAGCGGEGEPAPAADQTPSTTTSAAPGATSSTVSSPESVVFVGADGVESTITDVSRIVTLSGDLTEFVFELGLGDAVVATDLTTVEPPEAVPLPKVGVGRFLSAEAVLSFEPTLVLADTQTSPPTSIEQIRNAGVPVAVFDVPTTFDGLYEKVDQIGVALGVPSASTALSTRIEEEVGAALEAGTSLSPSPRVVYLYTRGPDVMLLFGEGMTTTALIRGAGGIDAGADIGIEGTIDVTPEALVTAAPDVIVVNSEGLAAFGGIDGFLAAPGVAQTPAAMAGRILDYPEGDFLTFGPRVAASLAALIVDLAGFE